MSDPLTANLALPDLFRGGRVHKLAVTVHAAEPVRVLEVKAVLFPGAQIAAADRGDETELSVLQARKLRLLAELEAQIEAAVLEQRDRQLSFFARVVRHTADALQVVSPIGGTVARLVEVAGTREVPAWAREALRVEDFSDLERLELEFVQSEPSDFLRRAFAIDKEKLTNCLQSLRDHGIEVRPGTPAQAGDSISFPFAFRASHVLRPQKFKLEFRVRYLMQDDMTERSMTVSNEITLWPSGIVVPVGGALGGATGSIG